MVVNAKRPMGRYIRTKWQLYVMILPAAVLVAMFSYRPMYGVMIAFKDFSMRKGILGSPWAGLENFDRLFRSYWFPIILENTITISALTLIIAFPLPVLLALMLNEVKRARFRKLFQTVSYAPYFVSVVITCSMITLFLNYQTGTINRLMNLAGIESFAFLQSSEAFKWIYLVSHIWQNLGWSSIIFFAALSGVSEELYEAASIDGASRLQRMVHINLPALIPTIAIMLVLQCGSIMSLGYEKVYLLQNSNNLIGSEIIATYVYKVGLQDADFSFATAVGLFNSVVNTVLLLASNAISKKLMKVSLF